MAGHRLGLPGQPEETQGPQGEEECQWNDPCPDDAAGETLFIDARKLGRMIDRVHRELSDDDIKRIADTYHAWRGDKDAGDYADVPGFCKAARLDEIKSHSYVLTPGRYVGAATAEEDAEPFEEKIQRLNQELEYQFAESERLTKVIRESLGRVGYTEVDSQVEQ